MIKSEFVWAQETTTNRLGKNLEKVVAWEQIGPSAEIAVFFCKYSLRLTSICGYYLFLHHSYLLMLHMELTFWFSGCGRRALQKRDHGCALFVNLCLNYFIHLNDPGDKAAPKFLFFFPFLSPFPLLPPLQLMIIARLYDPNTTFQDLKFSHTMFVTILVLILSSCYPAVANPVVHYPELLDARDGPSNNNNNQIFSAKAWVRSS